MTCPFAALGLEPTATPEEVKQAFRTKARLLHPDLGGDADQFDALRALYNEALHIATTRPCPECGGSKKITRTVGWSSIQLTCPRCG